MSRRIVRIFSPFALSTCLFFILVSTSAPAFAQSVAKRSPMVSTSVLCQATFLSFGWTQTGNGPASFGCGGSAWQATTPTSADATYDLGTITNTGTYTLRAFITNQAKAPVDYVIQASVHGTNILIKDCVYYQSQGIAWVSVCQFTVPSSVVNTGRDLTVYEHSGAVHSFIMSSSAIQILPA